MISPLLVEAGSHHKPNDPDLVSDEATPSTDDTSVTLAYAGSRKRRGGFRDDVCSTCGKVAFSLTPTG